MPLNKGMRSPYGGYLGDRGSWTRCRMASWTHRALCISDDTVPPGQVSVQVARGVFRLVVVVVVAESCQCWTCGVDLPKKIGLYKDYIGVT